MNAMACLVSGATPRTDIDSNEQQLILESAHSGFEEVKELTAQLAQAVKCDPDECDCGYVAAFAEEIEEAVGWCVELIEDMAKEGLALDRASFTNQEFELGSPPF